MLFVTKPEPKPEGHVLKRALEQRGISARKAASLAGISDTRLRHILNGYQPLGREQYADVIGPPETIARVAVVLGVDPDEFRNAGRDDVAETLDRWTNQMSRRRHPSRSTETRLHYDAMEEMQQWIDTGDLNGDEAPAAALRFWTLQQILDEVHRRFDEQRDRYELALSTVTRNAARGGEVDAGQAEAEKTAADGDGDGADAPGPHVKRGRRPSRKSL